MYLDSTKAGKYEGAADKFTTTTALRRDFPLGGFGSQGSKGAQTPSRKPPSQYKEGRVLFGKRKEEGRGQNTALEKWLTSGQGRKGMDSAKTPEGVRDNFEEARKEEGREEEGKSPKEGREGIACPEKDGTLSQGEQILKKDN